MALNNAINNGNMVTDAVKTSADSSTQTFGSGGGGGKKPQKSAKMKMNGKEGIQDRNINSTQIYDNSNMA